MSSFCVIHVELLLFHFVLNLQIYTQPTGEKKSGSDRERETCSISSSFFFFKPNLSITASHAPQMWGLMLQ